MEIQKEILSNLNTRYVLVKISNELNIVDKKRKTMVVIEDPIINVRILIKKMIKMGVEVFISPNDLPEPTEKFIRDDKIPMKIKLFLKKIYDHNLEETGSVITALTDKLLDEKEKKNIEELIAHYAYTVLYPKEGINIYSEINSDLASLIIIKGINSLPSSYIDGKTIELFDW